MTPRPRPRPAAERPWMKLRLEMHRQGVSQGEIAELLDIWQPQVSRRLSNGVPWKPGELAKIAKFLGVKLDSILDRESVSAG
jgi:transcriptional regulator with XRE-family HTH domain